MAQGTRSTDDLRVVAARRLLRLRRKGESDAALARRMGITSQHVYNYKAGKGVSLEVLARIAESIPRDDVLYVITGRRGRDVSDETRRKAEAFDRVLEVAREFGAGKIRDATLTPVSTQAGTESS